MSRGSDENLGFLSRMSELELKLKQSEDERLALEDKFNKLLSARRSEEEMQLFLLRENYSQLLRQDKMRCDRNDMILQTLASVESRASMLTAKTDRLRLLRQHYESYVSRHYPVLKKSVGRHRSVESLISDINENPTPRSASSSPRLTTYSPSPFVRSPSLTRRNSLVVSNSEILDPSSYSVPNRINLNSHSSRRKLFENSPKLDKNLYSKTVAPSLSPLRYDTKDDSFKNKTPTFIVSNIDQSHVEMPSSSERTRSDLLLQIPSYRDNSNKNLLKNIGEFSKREREPTFTRMSQPFRSNSTREYDKLSPVRGSVSASSLKPLLTKPLTKSSSFNIGSSYSRNVPNYLSPERRSPFIRRPSFVYRPSVVTHPLNRFQPSAISDFSSQPTYERFKSSLSDRSSFRERSKSPISERTKSSLSERANSPFSERGKSSPTIKSKSPLTVVDDIFKKYLINYDRRYLSDPISESKYGKYLYPLSHYENTYSEDQRRNQFSNLLESKYYDTRTSYYDDDGSISSRESVVPNLYKTYGSHDSLYTNYHQQLFHERDISYLGDNKDWKEWNHYRTRYEYPPTLGFNTLQEKPNFVDDSHYSVKNENISKEIPKTTTYDFPDDFSIKYSDSLKFNERDEYIPSEIDFEKINRSKESLKPFENNATGKQDLTSKDTFKMPQTPKKVSFSNEFLYDDKSDTEMSSNIDEVILPDDHTNSPQKINSRIKTSPSEKSSSEVTAQDVVSLSRETEQNESRGKLGIENVDEISKVNGEMFLTKQLLEEDATNSNKHCFDISKESGDTEINSVSLDANDTITKALESTNFEEEAEMSTKAQSDSNQYPYNTGSNIDQLEHMKETTSNDNYSLLNDYEKDLSENKEKVSVENVDGIKKEVTNEEKIDNQNEKGFVELQNISTVESKTSELISSLPDSKVILNTENGTFTEENDDMKFTKNNIQHGKEINIENDIKNDSVIEQDSTTIKYGSSESLQKTTSADFDKYDTNQTRDKVDYNEDQQVAYDTAPHEQSETYGDHTGQPYHDPNVYPNTTISEYGNDYNREQYDQPQQQYDQYGQQLEGYVSEEYAQNEVPSYDQTEDVYGSEQYGPKDYQQPEVYSTDQYEQQHLDYDGDSFSQQNVQDYQQPLPQQQYEKEQYIPEDQYQQQYKEGDESHYPVEHYPPENIPQDYVREQPYEGEYPADYSQQQYDPNYQDPLQISKNAPEHYDTAYQDDSQYGYNQVDSTYDEQYEQHGPQYDQQQEPPYDQYEQQPPEHYDDQYQAAPDQYGNYDYTYDQTAPIAEQPYLGDEQQTYVEETQPYDYNEPLQQPYDDVPQQHPYNENIPYEEMQQTYPSEQNIYKNEQEAYETTDYASQNLDVSQHENVPSDYDYTVQSHSSPLDDPQLSTQQQDAPLYEPETNPYPEADHSTREADMSGAAPKLNQVLESAPELTISQGAAPHENSSDFDLSTSQK